LKKILQGLTDPLLRRGKIRCILKKENNMSDNDNDDTKRVFSSKGVSPVSKPYVAPVASVKAEHIPMGLPSNVVGAMRASLEHDHGLSANELPNSDESIITVWAGFVMKNGTFANALKDLIER
jgi:hypothetical protein